MPAETPAQPPRRQQPPPHELEASAWDYLRRNGYIPQAYSPPYRDEDYDGEDASHYEALALINALVGALRAADAIPTTGPALIKAATWVCESWGAKDDDYCRADMMAAVEALREAIASGGGGGGGRGDGR